MKRVISIIIVVLLFSACGAFQTPSPSAPDGKPSGESSKFMKAEALALDGNCGEAEDILQTLSEQWLSFENNAAAVDALKGMCAFYWYGRLDKGEELMKGAAGATGQNASMAQAYLAEMRAHACDFDGAIEWAYKSTTERQPYLVDRVIAMAAFFYLFQGRPELARRNAKLFLDQYPHDWYASPSCEPPAGMHYDRDTAAKVHREDRAAMWVVLLGLGEDAAIGAKEMPDVLAFVDPSWKPSFSVGEDFLISKAGIYYHVKRLFVYQAAIRNSKKLGIDKAKIDNMEKGIEEIINKLNAAGGSCEETSAREVARAELALKSMGKAATLQIAPEAPPADADGDGILDNADACPLEPEVYNGKGDDDGCPDSTSAQIVEKQIVIDEQVHFETDSSKILPSSFSILDKVANLMKLFPQIKKVRVEGHTDRRGTYEHNMDLSMARAMSVVSYLVEAGVKPTRLLAAGYGYNYPIAFGDDEDSWKLNRRVEFLILEAEPILLSGAKKDSMKKETPVKENVSTYAVPAANPDAPETCQPQFVQAWVEQVGDGAMLAALGAKKQIKGEGCGSAEAVVTSWKVGYFTQQQCAEILVAYGYDWACDGIGTVNIGILALKNKGKVKVVLKKSKMESDGGTIKSLADIDRDGRSEVVLHEVTGGTKEMDAGAGDCEAGSSVTTLRILKWAGKDFVEILSHGILSDDTDTRSIDDETCENVDNPPYTKAEAVPEFKDLDGDGVDEIIFTYTIFVYKDSDHKVLTLKTSAGEKVFRFNGQTYVEASMPSVKVSSP